MTTTRCDLCRCELYPQTKTQSGNIGTLRGLCYRCSRSLTTGKASARIIVAETKAMAERRVSR